MMKLHTFALSSLLLLGVACSQQSFSPTSEKAMEDMLTDKSVFFPLNYSEAAFEQIPNLTNEMTLMAYITQSGAGARDLVKSDFVLSENSVGVSDFTVSKESSKKNQVVDIVFVVDVTGTMSEFIETAKQRLRQFILNSRAQGYHTRMCLSTFGDYTVKKCDRFFDNDPSGDMTQTNELISELAKLRAFKGAGQDPGWPDYDENPMRALIDASQAPFRTDAQKFVILVTDAGFLYSPGNQGMIGDNAPQMSEVSKALEESQATVFGVTPSLPGYTSSFQGYQSIVDKSKGEHFLFSDVIAGKVTLDQILSKIIDRINSTYRLTYIVDNIPNLDPTAPLDQRQVSLQLTSAQLGKIEDVKVSATFPTGKPQFIKNWKLSDQQIYKNDIQVTVNSTPVSGSHFSFSEGYIKFNSAPPASAKVKVRYLYADMYANLRLLPILLNKAEDPSALKITLNGIVARSQDLLIERNLLGSVSVTILPSALSDDYYQVTKNKGLQLEID